MLSQRMYISISERNTKCQSKIQKETEDKANGNGSRVGAKHGKQCLRGKLL